MDIFEESKKIKQSKFDELIIVMSSGKGIKLIRQTLT